MTRTPTEIECAWRNLAKMATGIMPARIYGEADRADAWKLRDDLELLAKFVDSLIRAYGITAREAFGANRIDLDLFTDQLSGALEGNCLYELARAGDDIEAERRDPDTAAEMRRELQAAE